MTAFNIVAQDKNKLLSVKDMYADLDYYFTNLQDVHPNPFIVLTKEEFQFKIDSIKQLITVPLSKKEFYLHITTLNRFTDLHSRIAGSRKMIKQQNVAYSFPIFSMTDNSIYFYDRDTVKRNVQSINGIAIKDIVEFFMSRRNLVEVNNEYNFVDILSFYINEHFIDDTIKLITSDNQFKSISFDYPPTKKGKKGKGKRVYHLETDTVNGVAVFELNTFMPQKIKEQIGFMSMINKVFDTLRQYNIKRLYIDITCNTGGLIAFEEYLLNHLLYDKQKKVSWDLVLKQSEQRKKQRGPFPVIKNGDFYQNRKYFETSNLKNKFKGEVYVIQSRHSFSAATTLASQLQTYRKSVVIGEESQLKAVYTDPILIYLPHSKFLFSCATGFVKNVGINKNKGVIPDISHKIYNIYAPISVKQAEMMLYNSKKIDN